MYKWIYVIKSVLVVKSPDVKCVNWCLIVIASILMLLIRSKKINILFNCDSSHVVYLLDCVWHFQYVGSTSTPFRIRFNNYKACYRKFRLGSSVPQMEFFKHFFWRRTSRIGYVRVSGNTSWTHSHPGVISFFLFFVFLLVFLLRLFTFSYYTLSLLILLLKLCFYALFYLNFLLLTIFDFLTFCIVLYCFTLFFSFHSGRTGGIIFSNSPWSHSIL